MDMSGVDAPTSAGETSGAFRAASAQSLLA